MYVRMREQPAGSGYARGPALLGTVEALGQPVSPVQAAFATQCPDPPGCPPFAANQCRAVLRQAVIEAIKLANNAASKIDTATKTEPGKRSAEAKRTADLFRFFFGHDPTRPVPWAGNAASGASVAARFRAVAKALEKGGRNTTFRCLNTRANCAADDFTCCSPGDNAWVRPPGGAGAEPNVVNLCAAFWTPRAGLRGLPAPYYRAGVLVHEMLHLLFIDFLRHTPPGRPNAHCYEAFALRLAGFGADPVDVCQCRGTPCPPP